MFIMLLHCLVSLLKLAAVKEGRKVPKNLGIHNNIALRGMKLISEFTLNLINYNLILFLSESEKQDTNEK